MHSHVCRRRRGEAEANWTRKLESGPKIKGFWALGESGTPETAKKSSKGEKFRNGGGQSLRHKNLKCGITATGIRA